MEEWFFLLWIAYLARRLAWSLVTIWAVVTATFLIYNVLPEDPARVIAGPVRPGADELERNPRARSATLRVLERLS